MRSLRKKTPKRLPKPARIKRDALTLANLDLVENIAQRVIISLPARFELAELVAAGNLGLVRAATNFDPERNGGTPFRAYARNGILGAILDSVGRRIGGNGHNTDRYLNNTCASIDERPYQGSPDLLGNDAPGLTVDPISKLTDAQAALARMAHQPTAPIAIDRARQVGAVSEAISWLDPEARRFLSLWYHESEPHPRLVARLVGLTLNQATERHDLLVANLRARLTGTPMPRAA